MYYVVVCAHGLEPVCAEEIASIRSAVIESVHYRMLHVRCPRGGHGLLQLRCAEDVFTRLWVGADVGRHRDALARLTELGASLDVRGCPRAAVTVTLVGRRNYRRAEAQDALAAGLGLRRVDDRDAELAIRMFATPERAWIGARLGVRPLHRRAWMLAHRIGSVRPTIAAAMVRLANVRNGSRVLDPCCGAGTIAIEAALVGANVDAADLDVAALEATRTNANAAAISLALSHRDAQHETGSRRFDAVISNPPWGGRLAATDVRAIADQARRCVVPGGRIVLLTEPTADVGPVHHLVTLRVSGRIATIRVLE